MIKRKFFSQFQRGNNLTKLSQVYQTLQISTVKLPQLHSIYTHKIKGKTLMLSTGGHETALLLDIKWAWKGKKQGRSIFLKT